MREGRLVEQLTAVAFGLTAIAGAVAAVIRVRERVWLGLTSLVAAFFFAEEISLLGQLVGEDYSIAGVKLDALHDVVDVLIARVGWMGPGLTTTVAAAAVLGLCALWVTMTRIVRLAQSSPPRAAALALAALCGSLLLAALVIDQVGEYWRHPSNWMFTLEELFELAGAVALGLIVPALLLATQKLGHRQTL